jgi:hypothetical protein
MDAIRLLVAPEDPKVCLILEGVIGIYETAFPGQIGGYYLTGSHAEGNALPVSDIDLTVLFKGRRIEPELEARADRLADCCCLVSPVELDIAPVGEEIPYPLRAVSLKLGSRLVYGEDLRDRVPLPPREEYVRHAMDLASRLLVRLQGAKGDPSQVVAPPDPADEFLGYARSEVPAPESGTTGGTKELVVTVGLMATAILAFRAGRYATGKADAVRQYRTAIGDEWAGFIEEVYERCRNRWGYRAPQDPAARRQLRELCARTSDFTRHFLQARESYRSAGREASDRTLDLAQADSSLP